MRLCPPIRQALGYVTQTTLSVDDTAGIIARLRERFPLLADPAAESICYATTNRQDAVKLAADGADHFLIVGAPNSSNSKRLVEVALKAGARNALLVRSAADIPWDETGGRTCARSFSRGIRAGNPGGRDHRGDPFPFRHDDRVGRDGAGNRDVPGHARAARRSADPGRHGLCQRRARPWPSTPTYATTSCAITSCDTTSARCIR